MTKVRVLNTDSPVLQNYGILVGDIGEVLENDFKEKYDYKILFTRQSYWYIILYFYKDEVEEIND